jgi:hypothetical protein
MMNAEEKRLYEHPMCPAYPNGTSPSERRQLTTLAELQRQAHILAHAVMDLSEQLGKHVTAHERGEI